MKKLLVATIMVCIAVAANAATVSWKSGTSIKPDGSAAAASGTLNLFVWTVSESVYNSTEMSSIWSTYGNKSIETMTNSSTTYKLSFGSSTGGTASSQNIATGTTLYGIIIAAYDSDKDGTVDMYAVNKATGSVNDSGTPTSPNYLAKFQYGENNGTAVTWTAVPEPTSGLLLLLGIAGLALKRKCA